MRHRAERDRAPRPREPCTRRRARERQESALGETAVQVDDPVAGAAAPVVRHHGHHRVGGCRGDQLADRRVERLVDAPDGVRERSGRMARRARVVEAPEMVRHRVRLAEDDHEGVPALAPEEHPGERRAPRDAVAQTGEGGRVPAGPGGDLLEVGEGQASDEPFDLRVERTRMDEGAVDRRGERAVEAAHHHARHGFWRIGGRHGHDRDAAAGGREPRPQRGRPAMAAVDEADGVGARYARAEVEDAVPSRIDARHHRRPGRERRGRHGGAETAPRPVPHQPGGCPRAHQIEAGAVEPDDE